VIPEVAPEPLPKVGGVAPARPDALDRWNEPLAPEERAALLDALAEAVRRRGLRVPTLFFVEVNRPLGFVASQGLIALTPLLAPLLGLDRLQNVGRLLADPATVDELVARLEEED
jgi:hypothetical protein